MELRGPGQSSADRFGMFLASGEALANHGDTLEYSQDAHSLRCLRPA